jgi:hypothetical protein
MQVNELRNGNLINYMMTPTDCSIKTIYAISQIYGETAIYTPIPINEEWILKLGLYEIGNKRWRFNNYVIEHWNNMYVIKYISMKNEFIQIGKEIKYVHQFQNVVFALTGEELTLSVP